MKEQQEYEFDLEHHLNMSASSSLDQSLQLLLAYRGHHVRGRNLGFFGYFTAGYTMTLIQTRTYLLNILASQYLLD